MFLRTACYGQPNTLVCTGYKHFLHNLQLNNGVGGGHHERVEKKERDSQTKQKLPQPTLPIPSNDLPIPVKRLAHSRQTRTYYHPGVLGRVGQVHTQSTHYLRHSIQLLRI
jgi:hypothetical protein